MTLEQFRAQIDAAKRVAEARFAADWNGNSPSDVARGVCREANSGAKDWGDAARRAHVKMVAA
jgi:hypothetical protein